MLYKLIYHLAKDRLLLCSVSPYNVDDLFLNSADLRPIDKKQFCIFIDLIRSLVDQGLITIKKEQLLICNGDYRVENSNKLESILENEMKNQSAFLNFIYGRIQMKNTLNLITNQLSPEELKKQIADGKQ